MLVLPLEVPLSSKNFSRNTHIGLGFVGFSFARLAGVQAKPLVATSGMSGENFTRAATIDQIENLAHRSNIIHVDRLFNLFQPDRFQFAQRSTCIKGRPTFIWIDATTDLRAR